MTLFCFIKKTFNKTEDAGGQWKEMKEEDMQELIKEKDKDESAAKGEEGGKDEGDEEEAETAEDVKKLLRQRKHRQVTREYRISSSFLLFL